MNEKRFTLTDWHEVKDKGKIMTVNEVINMLNEQQEQLDLYKEAILTMLGLLADKGIIFSGVKDE